MRNGSHINVLVIDCLELPKFVLDILSLGPKHRVKDKFSEMHYLADVENLYVSYARINLRVRSFVNLRRPQNGIQKMYRQPQWIERSKKFMIT